MCVCVCVCVCVRMCAQVHAHTCMYMYGCAQAINLFWVSTQCTCVPPPLPPCLVCKSFAHSKNSNQNSQCDLLWKITHFTVLLQCLDTHTWANDTISQLIKVCMNREINGPICDAGMSPQATSMYGMVSMSVWSLLHEG